jgi:hypothetical protein
MATVPMAKGDPTMANPCQGCAYETSDPDSCEVFESKPLNCWARATMREKAQRDQAIVEYAKKDKEKRGREGKQ